METVVICLKNRTFVVLTTTKVESSNEQGGL